jgi:hypothetical protein
MSSNFQNGNRPEWSQGQRVLYWYVFRNPLQNFRCYVIGCQDRNYEFTAKVPANTVQRDDLDPHEFGFQWSVIWLTIPLPFISYSGRWTTWYAGWQPSGIFGLKFNLHVPPRSFPRSRDVEPRHDQTRHRVPAKELTGSEVTAALQTALGNEVAGWVLQRNPSSSPDQKRYVIDEVLNASALVCARQPTWQPTCQPQTRTMRKGN